MFWVFVFLFLLVIGAKYYTSIGTRNLERRLNRVRASLEGARQKLREERERQSAAAADEERAELRVRFMKELIQDLQLRLSQPDESEKRSSRDEISEAVMRF